MHTADRRGIYSELGVRHVINCLGNATLLCGSRFDGQVLAAIEEANETFVAMDELLEKSGIAVAGVLGSESALVTSGAFAALALGAAGIMTGSDAARIARIPDTTGMPNEFLIQASAPNRYARAVEAAGGKLVVVGQAHGTTVEQLAGACGPRTAAIAYSANDEGNPGVLPLPEVVRFALDHEAWFAVQDRRLETLLQALADLPGTKAERSWPRQGAWRCLQVTFLGTPGRVTAAEVQKALKDGDPCIRVHEAGGQLFAAVHNLKDEEVGIVARRLRQLLAP